MFRELLALLGQLRLPNLNYTALHNLFIQTIPSA
jgi:hypothetical protein